MSDEQNANPYESPESAGRPPLPPEPNANVYLAAGAVVGAIGLAVAEGRGLTPPMSMLPQGLGGAVVGGLIGAIAGRVVGRLLVANHRFRQLQQRRHDRRDEFEDRYGPRDH